MTDYVRQVRAHILSAVRPAVSLGLLLWLIVKADWAAVTVAATALDWPACVASLGCFALAQLFGAKRWQLLLRHQGVRVSLWDSVRLTFLSLFLSNLLPSTVGGDAAKVVVLGRRGWSKRTSAASVIADRLINVLAIVLLGAAVAAPHLPAPLVTGSLPLIVGALVAVAVIVWTVQRWSLGQSLGQRLAGARRPAIVVVVVDVARELMNYVKQWRHDPARLLVAVLLSWCSFLCGVTAAWVLANDIGIRISGAHFTAIMVTTYLVSLVPVALNGVGVQEASIVTLLDQTAGVDAATAIGFAVTLRLVFLACSAIGVLEIGFGRSPVTPSPSLSKPLGQQRPSTVR